jgi:hypothetical protein
LGTKERSAYAGAFHEPATADESEVDPGALQQRVEQLEKELSKRSELFGQNFENNVSF